MVSDSRHEIINDNVDVGVRIFLSKEAAGFKSLHWHSHIEIVLVLEGEVTFHFNHQEVVLKPNEFVVVGSEILHATSNLANVSLVLQIPVDYLNHYWPHSELLLFSLPTSERDKWSYDYQAIASLLKEMTKIYAQKEMGYLLLFNSKMLDALYRLITKYSVSLAPKKLSEKSQIKDILSYVYKHYQEPLSVNGIANRFHYHPDYLSRKFKIDTGLTLTRYIRQLRLEHIHQDVLNTNIPVNDLFKKHGLNNRRLGIQLFKKLYDSTPMEIRRNRELK
ncbi:helix-turn-helix domain-containing protein [Secundilactobacillus kimchicus]|uniref:AraC-like transcriptional regulator n=1 Tax=Secundilactobacillus kimchicus JCM 15530 TaxID=1302272 RepID=A0A0R1HNB7_9LACO|nr:AraC family transcriptional regulator [Secundilactobacillus kimchicus]KRK48334.1 AraC-like transcriptional regulator [Secundilactobacillus kimchicus JCM 15530]MBT9671100.1 helix-turn-helix domain-containing protein [Secundilactobacillus kimchicus]